MKSQHPSMKVLVLGKQMIAATATNSLMMNLPSQTPTTLPNKMGQKNLRSNSQKPPQANLQIKQMSQASPQMSTPLSSQTPIRKKAKMLILMHHGSFPIFVNIGNANLDHESLLYAHLMIQFPLHLLQLLVQAGDQAEAEAEVEVAEGIPLKRV